MGVGIPGFVVSPGEMLEEEFMKPLGITQAKLAEHLGISARRINEICRGKRAISVETAILLGRAFKMEPRYWMDLQTTYELAQAKQRHLDFKAVKPIKASA